MPLTLLVHDLLPPADAPVAMRALRLPALEKLLAHADPVRETARGHAWLLRCWGLRPDTPLAPITLAADGGPREGTWLRADPVHQRIDRDALVLHGAGVLELTREEADAAVAALNAFLADDGLVLEAPHPERWYVRIPPDEKPLAIPIAEAAGRNPFGLLPAGGRHFNWRLLFSEVQMLLASLPFNQAREAQGRPMLNGLWFWGAGEAPAVSARPFAMVAAHEPLARGLALLEGTPVQPLPATLAGIAARSNGDLLVVLDDLSLPLQRGDAEAWCEAARRFERDWFAPLAGRLRELGPVRLVLPSGSEVVLFDLQARQRWRLWRRAKPLAGHA